MTDRLNLPQELDSLIEKREVEDRREDDRRQEQAAGQANPDDEKRASKDPRSVEPRRQDEKTDPPAKPKDCNP